MGVKSEDGGHKTVVYKKDIPAQSKICAAIGIKSPKTLRTHLKYLIDKGYVIECENGDYELPEMENIFFMIPLDTLKYLNDNCKEHVIKIYIYLGQRYKYSQAIGHDYLFSLEELGEHVGIKIKNNSRGYEIVNNALDLLENSGLVEYIDYFDGAKQKKKITLYSFEYARHKNETK